MSSTSKPKSKLKTSKPTIMVVGAGIVGATTALALVERGFNVTVLERDEHVANATSKANGAQLSYGYADAMASPGLIGMAGRILTGREPGMKFRLKPSLHNYSWLTRFIAQSSKPRFMRNTAASLELSLRSKEQMREWRGRYDFQFDHKVGGKIHILPDQKSIDDAAELITLKRQFSIRQTLLSPEEALEIEPSLSQFGGKIAGAIFTEGEEVGDPRRFAEAIIQHILSLSPDNRLLRGCKVEDVLAEDGKVCGLDTNRGQMCADNYVFAAGHWMPKFAKTLGMDLPIVPVAGYSLTYPKGPNAPQNSITDVKGKAVLCQLGDKVRIAGLADIGETSLRVKSDRLAQLKKVLTERFPGAAILQGDGEPWIGHRPVTPNSQPIVGQTKLKNAFVNCGHGTLGWTMAAACAVQLAEEICAQIGPLPDLVQKETTDYMKDSGVVSNNSNFAKSA
ncbi:FAD-dependent oxidoreductase [Maritalea sp.]|uniref:FAD-dependent oxidoreductase n=1 Tax=Maritalea sp. TaxID=2003361 RepID=UPI003EF673D3